VIRRGAAIGLLATVAVACGRPAPAPAPTAAPTVAQPLPGAQALQPLAWLAGTHRFSQGSTVGEELWTQPGGGAMFGVNRTFADSNLVAFEFMRITATSGGVVYTAYPGGRMPGTEFVLTAGSEPNTFVFENAEHDFPSRLVYVRIDAVHTQARAENDEKSLVFDFTRVP